MLPQLCHSRHVLRSKPVPHTRGAGAAWRTLLPPGRVVGGGTSSSPEQGLQSCVSSPPCTARVGPRGRPCVTAPGGSRHAGRSAGRHVAARAASVEAEAVTAAPGAATRALKEVLEAEAEAAALTHLEGNSWLLEVGGVRFLVDPALEGPIDFGVPLLVKVAKRYLGDVRVADVVRAVDAVLVTQALDDHLHKNTFLALAQARADIPIIAPPSAKDALEPLFSRVYYLSPGESLAASSFLEPQLPGVDVRVRATVGAVNGPPWQSPENGYIVSCSADGESEDAFSLYIEPHAMYKAEELRELQADVVVTNTIKVFLPGGFVALDGMEAAARLAQLLKCKTFVTYRNSDLDSSGILTRLLRPEVTLQDFEEMMKKEAPMVEVILPEPGRRILFKSYVQGN